MPNPVCIKIENVEPALVPPQVLTKAATRSGSNTFFNGEVIRLGDAKGVSAGFCYRIYAGFAENLQNDAWEGELESEKVSAGAFSILAPALKPETYEVQAFVLHSSGLRMYGDKIRVKVD